MSRADARYLEIGTGTGILGILCLQNGADEVVATDINPAAVANARYNAAMLADRNGDGSTAGQQRITCGVFGHQER